MTNNFSFSAEKDLTQSDSKRQLNRKLFEIVAPRYDLITRLLSLGRDRRWKKTLINLLPQKDFPLCVDLACGTGDLSLLLRKRFKDAHVIGIDITSSMLARAKKLTDNYDIDYLMGDMMRIPVKDSSVDIVTGGYALRNAPDLGATLSAIYTKLKPGGVATFLEFSRSKNITLQTLQMTILTFWTSVCGLLIHSNPKVYNYIPASLQLFPNIDELEQLTKSLGFVNFRVKKYLMGTMTIVIVEKPKLRTVI